MSAVGIRGSEGSAALVVGGDRGGVVPMILAYLALLCLIPPVLVLPGLGAAGRPASLFCLGLLLWWTYSRAIPQPAAGSWVPIRWAMFAYTFAAVLSTAAGQGRGLPGVELRSMDRSVLLTLGFLGLTLALIDGVRSVDDVERLLRWAVILGSVSCGVAIIQFTTRMDPTAWVQIPGLQRNIGELAIPTRGRAGYARVRGIARHSIEFGVVSATLLPIGLSLISHGTARRRGVLIATTLIIVTLPMSISRSAILGLVIGIAVFAVGWTWRQRANAAALAVIAVLGFQAITPGLLGTIRSLFRRVGSDNSTTGRTDDYAAVGEFVRERPWFGRGLGTFTVERYRVLDNEYLGTLIETGVVGLAALVTLLLCSLNTAVRVRQRTSDGRTRSLALGLAAAVAIAIVSFGTFDALFFPVYSGLLIFCIGCLGALDRVTATVRSTAAPGAPGQSTQSFPDMVGSDGV